MSKTTQDRINEIATSTEQIRQSISKKGVACSNKTPLEDYTSKIDSIIQIENPDITISYNNSLSEVQTTWLSSLRHNGRYIYYNNSSLTTLNDGLMSKLYGMGLQDATNTQYAFSSCSNLEYLPELIYLPKVTSATYMFSSCSKLKDLSGTTIQLGPGCSLSYMFQGCTQMTKAPLIVMNGNYQNYCDYMYGDCYKLNDFETIRQSSLIPYNMSYMFYNTQLTLDSALAQSVFDSMDLTKVSEASYCLGRSTYDSITKPEGWTSDKEVKYTLNLTFPSAQYVNLYYFFNNSCYHSDRPKFDYDFVSNTSGECRDLFREYNGSYDSEYYHPLRKITRVSVLNANNFYRAFRYCSFLTTIEKLEISSRITNLEYLFDQCRRLTTLPVFNTSGVTHAPYMFRNCTSLETIPELNFAAMQTAYNMFEGCTHLRTIPQLNTPNLTSCYQMFYNCTSLESLPEFDTSRVSDLQYMFYNCSSLVEVPAFNMISCTNAPYMFSGCSNLERVHCRNIRTNLDISYSTKFTREALLEVINNLTAISDSTRTLTIGQTNLSKLLPEDIAIATSKNWTLA